MFLSESIREKTESNLAANISIHIVIHIVTCQTMILSGERIFSGWADMFLRPRLHGAGDPVQWGKFLLFFVPQSVKTKETNPTRPGSPTPCKQGLRLF